MNRRDLSRPKHILSRTSRHDLLSVKDLNKAGYRIVMDGDSEEQGVYAVEDDKVCKSKSFPFLSEHLGLFYQNLNNCLHNSLEGCRVMSYGTEDWGIARTGISETRFTIQRG